MDLTVQYLVTKQLEYKIALEDNKRTLLKM